MRILRAVLLMLGAAAFAAAQRSDAVGEFSAEAKIDTPQGTRRLAFNVAVTNPMTPEQALPLKKVLEDGGQQALLNAVRGGGRGKLKLGAVEYPADLVVAQPIEDGYRYVVVTARQLQYDEVASGSDSVNYPFGVFVFEVTEFRSGEGVVYPQAALSISAEGRVQAEQFGGEPGTLSDIRRVR